jgi:hypothetical protein
MNEPKAAQDWSKIDLFEIDDAELALLEPLIEEFDGS